MSSSGSTIASVPYARELKPLCVEEGDIAPPPQDDPGLIKIRLADSAGHRSQASFLVRRRYAWRGYEIGKVPGALPNRITFSACDGDDTFATISVGLDSALGLFVDKLYRDEVDSIRAQNRKVCEFTKLAVESGVRSRPVLAALFHIAFIYARLISGCTDLVVEVNPRHVLFYKRMLGFSDWGPERHDPRVQAPAILLRLDLAFAQQQIAEMGGHGELAIGRRSLYPFFFSAHEEVGIERRLRALG
jgi:hypothetical protein